MKKEKKYNYIGYTSGAKKISDLNYVSSSKLRYIYFCSCGHKTIFKDTPINKVQTESLTCEKCKGLEKVKKTIVLNARLDDNEIKINYKTFIDGDLIKLVKFSDYIGVGLNNNLFVKTKKISLSFNRKTKRFYLNGNSYSPHLRGVGIQNISHILREMLELFSLNNFICDNPQNNIPKIRDIFKNYIQPYNEFLNLLLKEIDYRDIERVSKRLFDVNNKNVLFYQSESNIITNKANDNLTILISLIQYPNFSSLFFNLENNQYIKFLENLISVSNFNNITHTSIYGELSNVFMSKVRYSNKRILMGIKIFHSHKFKNLNFPKYANYSNLIKFIEQNKIKDNVFSGRLFPKVLEMLRNYKFYDFVKSNKLPKYIIKDIFSFSKKQNTNIDIISVLHMYYTLLYNDVLDEKEICNLIKKYGILNFSECTSDFFNIYEPDYGNIKSIDKDFDDELLKHYLKINFKNSNSLDDVLFFNLTSTYKDCINILKENEEDYKIIINCKTKEEVRELHDKHQYIFNLKKIEKFNKKIKEFSNRYEKIKLYSKNNIQFNLIDNVDSISKEGNEMKHCVRTYARRLSEGKHLIFSIQDMENNDRATLEFFNDKNESDIEDFWIFNQLKAKYNKRASDKIINSLQDFVDNFLVKNSLNIKINYNSYDLINKEKENLLNNYNHEIIQQHYNRDNFIEIEGEDELPF